MSGVAIARYLLAHHAGLTAVVPAARIVAGVVPPGTVLPAIGITQVSGSERNTVAGTEPKKLVAERVQVTILAASYPQQKELLGLLPSALPATRGTINGFACDSITPEGEGPDLYSADPVIYEQSKDFFIRYIR